ncbi:Uncharacterised protein [Vibrio cholerae]|nr:Uncharacterised protein [Vibrio cholerae]
MLIEQTVSLVKTINVCGIGVVHCFSVIKVEPVHIAISQVH